MPGEGVIFYDIRFTAYVKDSEIKILINIEAQRSTDPGKLKYHLEDRIIFYLARMVSAQKQTEFFHSFDERCHSQHPRRKEYKKIPESADFHAGRVDFQQGHGKKEANIVR